MRGVVDREFDFTDEVGSISFRAVDQVAYSDLNDLVCSFQLSIRLWVVGHCNKEVCMKNFEEGSPKFDKEHFATVSDNLLRNPSASVVMFEKCIGPLNRTLVFLFKDKYNHLGELVCYCYDQIIRNAVIGRFR